MMVTDNIKFTKNEYTLKDFGMFKLCPAMYALSILYPDTAPMKGVRLRLRVEAEILLQTLAMLSANKKTYLKGTSLFLADAVDCFNICLKNGSLRKYDFTSEDIALIADGLYDKAQRITEDIHRWIKGTKYTIEKGGRKVYTIGTSSFIYSCSFRAVDGKIYSWRSINADEYLDFPVISSGENPNTAIRYSDIMELLSGDDIASDRVGAIIMMMRKINTQFESGFYEDDGIKRVAELINDIQTHDFTHFCKKPSEFCNYCKYFDKCRQLL